MDFLIPSVLFKQPLTIGHAEQWQLLWWWHNHSKTFSKRSLSSLFIILCVDFLIPSVLFKQPLTIGHAEQWQLLWWWHNLHCDIIEHLMYALWCYHGRILLQGQHTYRDVNSQHDGWGWGGSLPPKVTWAEVAIISNWFNYFALPLTYIWNYDIGPLISELRHFKDGHSYTNNRKINFSNGWNFLMQALFV